MVQKFIRGCIINPALEQEVQKVLEETRKAAQSGQKAAQSVQRAADKIGPDTRTIIVAAGLGLLLAGVIAGAAMAANSDAKKFAPPGKN